jgi:hypothetical protein
MKWSFCLVYLDDIIIFSKTFEEHINHLRQVFNRIREANLTVKGSKSKFAQSATNYLGHVVDEYGVRPLPKKIKAVMDFPTPQSQVNIQQFLGLAGYYRKFIPNLAKMAAPLLELFVESNREGTWNWNEQCQSAFNKIKEALTHEPILRHPDFSRPFIVETDASTKGLGAILSQEYDGELHPVEFISRTLTKDEAKWSATELEALGVIWACERFRHYLLGRRFKVLTDHNALKWVLTSPKKGRLQRWGLRLQEFDFEVYYRKGSLTVGADALSRNPIPAEAEDHPNDSVNPFDSHLETGARIDTSADTNVRFTGKTMEAQRRRDRPEGASTSNNAASNKAVNDGISNGKGALTQSPAKPAPSIVRCT